MSPAFKRLALFAALSVVAHAVTLGGLRVALPEEDAPEVLETRLQPRVEAPAPVAAPVPRRTAAPRNPPPPTAALPAVALPGPAPAPREQVAIAETAPAAVEAPAETAAAPTPPEPPMLLAVRQLPRHGEIRYQVFYGSDKFSVGAAQAVWDTTVDT